ncbi:response regulator transcription factor [Patescibacteria group bacterium]
MANKPKILLIEDDSFLSSMYVTKLEISGFDVEAAEDGETGLEKVKSYSPDLVLLDIILPKMSGFEVLESIRKDDAYKDIPVIMLTNLSQRDDVERGLDLGAQDYLIKAHFTPSEVVTKIKKYLG